MADGYKSYSATPVSTARKLVAVTPSDATDLTAVAKALYIGGGGDVEVIAADDTDAVVLKAVPAGAFLPVQVRRVLAGNTSATLIVALYD